MADNDLLRAYVRDGSQAAFAALVERYVAVVYSAAVRQLRDRHEAEDATQAVFLALAKGAAKIEPGTVLCGWLLTATRYVAANRLRSESRRRHHEREAATVTPTTTPAPGATPDPWREVAPMLDEAIAGLGAANKDAVLLRYFEGKSSRDVAAALGISEDAARQRVSRGVEELRGFFARRGVTLAAMAVATLLSVKAVQAAPPGLAFSTVSAATAAGLVTNATATAGGATAGAATTAGGAAASAAAAGLFASMQMKLVATFVLLALVGGGTALWVWGRHAPGADDRAGTGANVGGGVGGNGIGPTGASLAPADNPVAAGERPGVGDAAPPLSLPAAAGGATVRLEEFRGRYVVLHFWSAASKGWQFEATELRHVYDRFGQDPRFAMVGVAVDTDAATVANLAAKSHLAWPQLVAGPDAGVGVRDAAKASDAYVLVARPVIVIDPDGHVLARNTDARGAYRALERALGKNPAPRHAPGVRVVAEHNPPGRSTPAYAFETVPPIAAGDAGEGAAFAAVGGEANPTSSFGVLTDGAGARGPDDPKSAFFFKEWWLTGRLRMDLGRDVAVAQVNTYAWHREARAAQVYRLYGAPADPGPSNLAPGIGVDPEACGWTLIATVDTRADDGHPRAGQDGVSVRAEAEGGSLGRFRYLLFVTCVTEIDDGYGNTFYNEIDVVEHR